MKSIAEKQKKDEIERKEKEVEKKKVRDEVNQAEKQKKLEVDIKKLND